MYLYWYARSSGPIQDRPAGTSGNAVIRSKDHRLVACGIHSGGLHVAREPDHLALLAQGRERPPIVAVERRLHLVGVRAPLRRAKLVEQVLGLHVGPLLRDAGEGQRNVLCPVALQCRT
jgi:hypothetical protein